MSRQGNRFIFTVVIIAILVIPIIVSFGNNANETDLVSDRISNMQLAETDTIWHDDCSSTSGWIAQSASSGFDPKHPILESGTLSTNGGYLIVTGIADPVTERKGPLYIKELGDTVSIDAIQMFQAEVEFIYASSVYGFLSVYLFDENKQKAVMLRLHDAWAASESHPESVYFTPGEAGDGTVHDEILFGSWSGYLRFWYNESTADLVGELDDGTPDRTTLKMAGEFDPDRQIKYIGIQWSRAQGVPYGEDGYRLLDVQLTYDVSEPSSGWLTGWENRKSHEIAGTPGSGVNYQVPIIVNYGTGTDSNNSVFCDSECQTDFDDIRFTSSDGVTSLDYWREPYFDSDNATFWVEVRDNLDSNVSIYMYYGNPNCTTTSDGPATFVFFDDFNDGTMDTDKWHAFGPWTESGGMASFAITGTGGMSILPSLRTDDAWDMRNKSIVSSWRFTEKSVNREWGVSCANTIGDDHTKLAYFIANDNGTHNIYVLYYDVNSFPDYDVFVNPGPIWYEGIFHTTEFTSTPSATQKNKWLLNNEILYTYSDYAFDASPQYIFLGFYVYGYSNTLVTGNLGMEFDYVYLRNEVGVDLEHGSWSDTESWLTGWNYRKSHDIIGASGAGENYQIQIVAHYGFGTDAGHDVYCHQQCQSDFDDIRFTDNDGFTLLDYWSESVFGSDNATFWVEVKDDLDYNTTIRMYYGNSTVSSLSNGTATFIFFDDFENNNLDRWDEIRWEGTVGTPYTCATDQVVHGTYALKFQATPGADIMKNLTETGDPLTHDFMVHSWVRDDNQLRGGHVPLVKSQSEWWVYACRGFDNQFSYLQDGVNYAHWPQNYTGGSDQWFEINVGLSMSTDKIRAWKNEFYMGEINLLAAGGESVPDDLFQIGFGQQSAYITWWDDTYVRKWVVNEPTHGSWDESSNSLQPSINHVDDFYYEAGTSGNVIEWSVMNFNPTSYELWRDGGLLTSEVWPGGSSIEVSIDNLAPGIYNYTIIVYGNDDILVSDIVFIMVFDLTSPSLGHPMNAIYEYGSTGNTIVWSVSDLYPGVYAITRDTTLIANASWTAGSIILDIDGLDNGEYIYTIVVSDTSFNIAFDSVVVTVVDTTAPILNHPSDILGNLDTASIQITWQPTDLLPFYYEIYMNGTQVANGTWTSGENLTYTLESLIVGSYNITISAWDTSGNFATDTVLVNIEQYSIQPFGDIMVITISIGSIAVIVVIVGLICRNKGGGPPSGSPSSYEW